VHPQSGARKDNGGRASTWDAIPRGRMWGGATRKWGCGAYLVWAGGRWGSEGSGAGNTAMVRVEGRRRQYRGVFIHHHRVGLGLRHNQMPAQNLTCDTDTGSNGVDQVPRWGHLHAMG
jgi:hypothetical protein